MGDPRHLNAAWRQYREEEMGRKYRAARGYSYTCTTSSHMGDLRHLMQPETTCKGTREEGKEWGSKFRRVGKGQYV